MSSYVQQLLDAGWTRQQINDRTEAVLAEMIPDPERIIRDNGWSVAIREVIDPEVGACYEATINGDPRTAMVARPQINALRASVCVAQQEPHP